MAIELWNAETGNVVGEFEREDAALDFVRRALRANGIGYVQRLLLGSEAGGRSRMLARGRALVDLARRSG